MIEKIKRFLNGTLQYLIPYLVGIVFAIVFTPVEAIFGQHNLLLLYLFMAVPAFCIVPAFYPFPVFGPNLPLVGIYVVSIASVLFGIATHFAPLKGYRRLGAGLLGFMLGFTGTVAVYCISISSM